MSYAAFDPFSAGPTNLGANIPLDGAFAPQSGPSVGSMTPTPWLAPERLTISFAPDGTSISGYGSQLFTAFRDWMTPNQVEANILKAFQQWARVASINAGYLADGGQQFGVNALTQGDPRFGDIRVGAIPMHDDVFAVSVAKHPSLSGSWGGEIIFNTNKSYPNVNEFYAVALHEIGHVLGLRHSAHPQSVMNDRALNTQLIGQDINRLRALYGVRRLDTADVGNKNNDSPDKATRIENPGSLHGTIPLIVYGDIAASTDRDYFELSPLSNYEGPIKFELVSSGISLLRAKLSIINENGQLLHEISGTGIRGNRLAFTIPQAVDGMTYYVRIEAADQSLYAQGSYALKVTYEDAVTADPQLIERVLVGNYWQLKQSDVREIFQNPQTYYFNQELMLNDSIATADKLKTSLPFSTNQHFQVIASLSYQADIDFYEIKSPQQLGPDSAITLAVQSIGAGPLVTTLQLFDEQQQLLPTITRLNGNGELVLQAAGIDANTTYFVAVGADQVGDNFDEGNYQLTVRFDQPLATVDSLADGSLSNATAAARRQYHALYVAETQMFHLALTASPSTTRELAQVWVTIYNRQAKPVFRALTTPGQTRTAKSVVLRPGSYTIQVSLADNTLDPISINYALDGTGITDPVGPELLDPSKKPFKKAGPGDPNYVYPGNILSPNTYITVNGNPGTTPQNQMQQPPFVDPNAWYWYPQWLTPTVPFM